MFEVPEKHSLGHLRAVKQLKTIDLDLEEAYFEDISRKQTNECELLNCKTIGTLGQMAITHLNNS